MIAAADATVVRGIEALDRHVWDVVVIGAGPAGSLAAYELARRGRSVLLVEKTTFPRWKVCGACVGGDGVMSLRRAGLGALLDEIGARPIPKARLLWRSRCATIKLQGMVAVSRQALDLALAHAAANAGATFRSGVRAEVIGDQIQLHHDGGAATVRSRSIVHAGGLRAARRDDQPRIASGSWIGLGTTSTDSALDGDHLTMAVGQRGYVGRVMTEDAAVNWAAAIDPAFLRACGGPRNAIEAICEEAGIDVAVPRTGWTGTPALTRRTAVQHGNAYRVGDASGYVEPITGEGISWALRGARALAGVLDQALTTGTHGQRWAREYARLLRGRRWRCVVVSRAMRSPTIMHLVMPMLCSDRPVASAAVHRMIGGSTTGSLA